MDELIGGENLEAKSQFQSECSAMERLNVTTIQSISENSNDSLAKIGTQLHELRSIFPEGSVGRGNVQTLLNTLEDTSGRSALALSINSDNLRNAISGVGEYANYNLGAPFEDFSRGANEKVAEYSSEASKYSTDLETQLSSVVANWQEHLDPISQGISTSEITPGAAENAQTTINTIKNILDRGVNVGYELQQELTGNSATFVRLSSNLLTS